MDTQEIEDAINIVSKMLDAVNYHAQIHNIDSIYNGFSDSIHAYKNRLSDIDNRLKIAIVSNSFEQYPLFNNEVIGIDLYLYLNNYSHIELKAELDLSELMHNFLRSRFHIVFDKSIRNPSEYSLENEIRYNEQLFKSKKEILEKYENECKIKLRRVTETINEQHKQEIDKLNEKLSNQSVIIESKNDEIRAYILRISELEKEKRNLEAKLNILKEETKYSSDNIFDEYHLKTWSFIKKKYYYAFELLNCKIIYLNFNL